MSAKKCLLLVIAILTIGTACSRVGSPMLIASENKWAVSQASINWSHLSSASGDLPIPTESTQQTSTLILDVDMDGVNDFVIGARGSPGPSLIWYRRQGDGWETYVLDDAILRIEAGGTFADIDGDNDLDIVMGGDNQVNQVWWWENPHPNYEPTTNWTRRLIKNTGSNKHHDQMFGDFDGDGREELVYWNQGADTLFIAEIPDLPDVYDIWPATSIYTYTGDDHEGLAKADIDGDGLDDIVGGGRWFKFNGGTSFSPQIIDGSQTFSRAAAGQLVEGGYPETVFVTGDGIGPLRWYQWDGTDWIGHILLDHDVDHGHSLQVADIDGDGNMDIFLGEMRLHSDNPDARTWIFYGDGQGEFTTFELSTSIGTHEGKVGDLDGDGDTDILGKPYDWDTPRVDIWLSDLACEPSLDEWARHEIDSEKPWRAMFVKSADLNGDSFDDVISGGWWYENPGSADGNWIRNTIGSPLNNMAAVYDFDGDGDIDILGTEGIGSASDPNFVWASNDGSGNFTIMDNIEAGTGDFLQGAAVDSFGAATEEVALSWHRSSNGVQMLSVPGNPSSQTWTWREISATTQNEDLSAGDIDRDGDLDLLLGTQWLRNDSTGDPSWWNSTWRYRVPVSVGANGFERRNKPVEIAINFTDLLNSQGENGEFDSNSIRVVEVDGSNNVLNEVVPFQFDPDASFDANSNALGTLIFILDGQMLSAEERQFHVYFDVTGHYAFTPPAITARVATTDNVDDEGQVSFRIETTNADYFYHKEGGGFASLDDADGNDWISYSTATGSAGEFRGIPNLVHPNDGGYFHPGAGSIVSSLVTEGPLKATIHSATPDSSWETLWEIFPDYARMTVIAAPINYWFLYEGTPGGSLDIDRDFVVRSDGTQTLAATSWTEAIEGPEWLFFGDPDVGRSLYLAHHEQDSLVDSYRPMNEEMTVFGFGRNANLGFLQNSNQFTIGLRDQTAHADVAVTVNGAFRPLGIAVGAAESVSVPASSGPWTPFTLSNRAGLPDRNRLADINGDGRIDAVVGYEAVSSPGLLAWYEAPAAATNIWSEHSIATIIGPMSVDTADMDGDGDFDVVAGEHNTADPTSAMLYVFENVDGQGQNWQPHIVYTGDEHHDGAQVVDIDNDGDLDIISIGWGHGRVLVYENNSCIGNIPPQPTPTATSSAPTATSSVPTATSPAPTATATPYSPTSCTPDPANILANPGFESGTVNWSFYTNGQGSFTTVSPAYQCEEAAQISINQTGSNMQFYQKSFLLAANTRYRLSFAAYSSAGQDLSIYLQRHSSPYTLYGLSGERFDLTQSWQSFSTEFTTSGFSGTTTDTRLRFWFSGLASSGNVYWIDDVVLEEASSSPTATPSLSPTMTDTPDSPNTPTATASHTPTGTASLTSTPTATVVSSPTPTNTIEPSATSTPTTTQVPTATATPDSPTSCAPDPANILANPGFESGTANWTFYTNGQGSFTTVSPAYQCEEAAQISINQTGSNMQFYQKNFLLAANTRYRLSFAAYSNAGQDFTVYLQRHSTPYTLYGVNGERFDLGQSWQSFSMEFTTSGFSGTTSDTRLRFWFSGLAGSGTVYWIDDVVLEAVSSAPTTTPSISPTMTDTLESTNTPTPTASDTPTPEHTSTSMPTATIVNSPTPTDTVEPAATSTPTATLVPTATATPDGPASCTPDPANILANPGFESGTANWSFYTNGEGSFTTTSPAYQCELAAQISINQVGSNMQFYQKNFLLMANTRYRLSFAAYSNNGQDVSTYVQRHSRPYTLYGLNGVRFDLTEAWQTFSTEFTTSGFSDTTTDTRLRFWFSGLGSNGTVYWIDDVQLVEIEAVNSNGTGIFDAIWRSLRDLWSGIDRN